MSEYIYEGVVEPSYKKSTGPDSNRAGRIRKNRGETTSSQTHYAMIERSVKRRKRFVDSLSVKSKTCLIHGPGHSSYECKVLV